MTIWWGGWCALLLSLSAAPAHAAPFGDIAVADGLRALERDDAAAALGHLILVAGAPQPSALGPAALSHHQIVARYLAGEAAMRLGHDDDALAYLSGLDAPLSDVDDLLWVVRGRALLHKKDWPQAHVAWRRVAEQSLCTSWRNEASYSLGDIAWGNKDQTLATHLYAQAVRRLPKHPRAALARLRLAEAAEGAGRFDAAADLLRQVADGHSEALAPEAYAQLTRLQRSGHLSPKSLNSQLTWVDHLLQAHSVKEAAELLAALSPLAQSPTEQEQIAQRSAQLAVRNHQYPEAIAMLQRLMADCVGRPKLAWQRELGQALAASGQTDAALRELDAVASQMASAKDIGEVQFRAAWLTYEAGRYAEAERRFGAYIEAHPHERSLDEAVWLQAWMAYHRGDLPTARGRLLNLQTRFAHSSLIERSQYWLGRIAMQTGQSQEAVQIMAGVAHNTTSYYAMLARQRLSEWGADPKDLPWQRGHLVASLNAMGVGDAAPPAGSARAAADMLSSQSLSPMPWDDDVFDWQSSTGTRIMRLIELGHGRDAAGLITRLPAVHEARPEQLEYARARLLYGLGDYAAAFRGVGAQSRRAIEQGLTPQSRRYFQLAYPQAHMALVQSAAQAYHVSPYLILAVMRQESAYNDGANSAASARGLMQIIPVTGRKIAQVLHEPNFAEANLRMAAISVRFGAWYLGELTRKFDGHLALAIGSYNAGPQAVSRWVQARPNQESDVFVEDIGFKETRNYVKHVLANLAMYEIVYRGTQWHMPPSVPTHIGDNVSF